MQRPADRGALLRYRLRRSLGLSPRLFRISVLARPGQWRITVGRATDVVIEGFPRSGNNFAFEAFQLANPSARIASRTHAPAQVRRAVALGLPTIVVLRRPDQAVLSMVVRQPYLSVEEGLRDWITYHRSVIAHRHGFVVAPFETVTSDYGSVIETLNARFGTSFIVFRNSEEADAAVLAAIEDHHRSYFGGRVLETHVARPSTEREALKQRARAELDDGDAAAALAEAGALYDELVTTAV